MNDTESTPLMRQYREIKRGYPGAILFFRVGDFYEMFDEDARQASVLLNIALTSRDKASADPIPLCGVPYHAASGYIAKLLKAGCTVALCEQVEDPKLAKGLVRREVVRLYTPGTLVDTEYLSPWESSFLAAVSRHSGRTAAWPVSMSRPGSFGSRNSRAEGRPAKPSSSMSLPGSNPRKCSIPSRTQQHIQL
jgi:DNA mismatch repair protein MutS